MNPHGPNMSLIAIGAPEDGDVETWYDLQIPQFIRVFGSGYLSLPSCRDASNLIFNFELYKYITGQKLLEPN